MLIYCVIDVRNILVRSKRCVLVNKMFKLQASDTGFRYLKSLFCVCDLRSLNLKRLKDRSLM